MRLRNLLLLGVLAAAVAFMAVNRSVFSVRAPISFLLGTVEVPIGVVMLALVLAIVLGFSVYIALWQRSILTGYRRQSRELQAQRSLADDAEASRFTALGALLRSEMTALDQRLEAALDAVRTEVREAENSLSATLGEMDDRLRATAFGSRIESKTRGDTRT